MHASIALGIKVYKMYTTSSINNNNKYTQIYHGILQLLIMLVTIRCYFLNWSFFSKTKYSLHIVSQAQKSITNVKKKSTFQYLFITIIVVVMAFPPLCWHHTSNQSISCIKQINWCATVRDEG